MVTFPKIRGRLQLPLPIKTAICFAILNFLYIVVTNETILAKNAIKRIHLNIEKLSTKS
nr:MAG TPA: hypothetical protein [Caudoviricetes sp.]